MNNNQNSTESDNDFFDISSQLEQQIQIENQETKNIGIRIDQNNTITIFFYKTTELNGSNYAKVPL